MAISKKRKQELLAEYLDLLERSNAVIVTDYRGLTVNKITEMRNRVREAEGVYHVAKNTLFQRALKQQSLSMPEEWFEGPMAVGFCFGEAPKVAKILADFAKDNENLRIKGALLGARVINVKQVEVLADLPPLDVLRAQIVGVLQAPAAQLVGVLNGVLAGFTGVLAARAEQLEGASGA